MTSTVYLMDLRSTPKENLFGKLERLLDAAGIESVISKRDLGGGKIPFGGKGNTPYIRPGFL